MHDPLLRTAGVLVLLFTPLLDGCSQSSSSTATCTLQLAGNTSESVNLPTCGAVTAVADAGAPDYQLSFQAKTAQVAQLDVSIDLGAAPEPGSFSSETATSWSATALTAANCAFAAGSAAVPTGSFTLSLSAVDTSVASASSAHGSLDLTMYVQSPPGTDCGVGNNEFVTIDF